VVPPTENDKSENMLFHFIAMVVRTLALPKAAAFVQPGNIKEILTEGEGSVQLTSSFR
jgi:hypothetical protein